MDQELKTLDRARGHVADITRLVEMAREHLREGRFEDARACLMLVEGRGRLNSLKAPEVGGSRME
ncbi:MAG: hypothetical protein M3R38_09605 [Actinomycetota bacterium]|nr:hypothetical protein [Actinomycetota bacterium]